MKSIVSCAKWIGAGLALSLSPAIIVFAVPFAFGIGSDVLENAGPRAVTLALAAATGVIIARRLPWRSAIARWGAPRPLTPLRNR